MVIHNKIIPFGKFKAINLFGFIFYKGEPLKEHALNHEMIHTAQMREMLYVFFYIWYFIEWLIKLCIYKSFNEAYRNLGFENEAYAYMRTKDYLKNRKHYRWFKLI